MRKLVVDCSTSKQFQVNASFEVFYDRCLQKGRLDFSNVKMTVRPVTFKQIRVNVERSLEQEFSVGAAANAVNLKIGVDNASSGIVSI